MDRTQKEDLVATMRRTFEQTSIVVVTHYIGLSVAEMTRLRQEFRDAGARFRVTKNRLVRLALDGTPYEGISHLFVGPTAIAYADDPVAVAKVVVAYAKANEKLVIVGAGLGAQAINADAVKALATMPSLDELRGKLLGVIHAPASKLVGVLPAPASTLVRVLDAPAGKLHGVFRAYTERDKAA